MSSRVAVPFLCVLLVLQSCFTTALWGGEAGGEEDPVTGKIHATAHFPPGFDEKSPVRPLLSRILLTPFAIALDCVTFPAQAFVYGWGENTRDD